MVAVSAGHNVILLAVVHIISSDGFQGGLHFALAILSCIKLEFLF
jgi:hypothetical protein